MGAFCYFFAAAAEATSKQAKQHNVPVWQAAWSVRLVVLGVCAWPLSPVSAHHFFAPEYERELRGTIRGVVEEVRYVNPHVQVRISISGAESSGGEPESWFANTVSPNAVGERGWRHDSIEPGDFVTVEGFLGRDGATRIWIQSIALESGEVFYPVGREHR